jgi:hypothetical protein
MSVTRAAPARTVSYVNRTGPRAGRMRTYRTTSNPPHRTLGVPNDRNQVEIPAPPREERYRLGWCANGCGELEVALTQLEPGGPAYPLCRSCNHDEAEYRDDYRGAIAPEEDIMDGAFRQRVASAYNRIVPAKLRGGVP